MKLDCELKNSSGNNSLHVACKSSENPEIVKYLINERKMDINERNDLGESILHLACENNEMHETIRYLVELKLELTERSSDLFSPLELAFSNNNSFEVIRYLVENHVPDLSFVDENGDTYLHSACRNLYKKIIKYMMIHYLNPQISNLNVKKKIFK